MMHPSQRCPPMVERSSRLRAMCRWHRFSLTVPFRLTISQSSLISRIVTPLASRTRPLEMHPTAESTTPAAMCFSAQRALTEPIRSAPRRSRRLWQRMAPEPVTMLEKFME